MSDAHFFLHHNPCQQTLVSRLIEKLSSEGKGSIFKQSTVIVRNQGMATWIKQQIANAECQIMMQVNFPQPNTFLSNLFPTPSVKSETLLWKIYETLPKVIHSPSFRLLKEYLSEPSTTLSHLKQYQLASTIADLYEKYLLYRPEWIEQWNKNQSVMNGIHEQWQRQLWNAIGGRDLYHWSQEIKNLNQQCDASQLPESVHIFGVSSFAPAYLNFLYSLSHRIPVHLYWLNPVDGYWADIPNKRDWILKNSFTEEVDPFSQNPLLASFGRMGREYVHNIYGGKKNEYLIQEEDFITNSDTTFYSLLGNLHHSLRSNIVPVQSDFQDNSIQIHACHSPMREVETLKDYLLGNSINSSTDTSDILVLCTDIKTYAPAVEAVFGSHNANSEKQLPFRIADRNSPIDNPNISVIPQLLRLRSSRFTNQDALHILQTPAILERFKLNKSDIPIITNWINNNGIRWGFSKEHVQQKIDVNIKSHWTWQEGLNRLLIGLTISGNDDKSRLWNGISPFIEVEGANLKLASSLCDYVQWCHSIYTDLGKELRLSEWIESCRNWVNEGFSSLDDFQSQLRPLYKALEAIEESADQVTSKIPSIVFAESLTTALSSESSPYGFLTGNITFCEMKPMRSIPTETICILGMSHDKFPRSSGDIQFDLTKYDRVEGDRSTRDDDQYLFLETLISAKKKLFISYVGFSIKDGTELPPSTSLQTLIDYLPGIEQQIYKEKLHSFDPSYFDVNSPVSFDSYLCSASEQLLKPKSYPELVNFHIHSEQEVSSVSLQQFISAITDPCKYFLKNTLLAKIDYLETPSNEYESIHLDGLESWNLNNLLIHKDEISENLLSSLQQKGILPPSCIGEHIYELKLKPLLKIKEHCQSTVKSYIKVEIDQLKINGNISIDEDNNNVILVSASSKSAKDRLKLRILQLISSYAYNTPHRASLFYLDKDKVRIYTIKEDENYQVHLHALIKIFRDVCQSPIPHFPKTAQAYWTAKPKKNESEEDFLASRKITALKKWNPDFNGQGECTDHAVSKFFPTDDPVDDLFLNVSEAIWQPLVEIAEDKPL